MSYKAVTPMSAEPNLITDLTGLLIVFRFRQVRLVADLEPAFLQIALNQSDRDVTCFFWRERTSDPAQPQHAEFQELCLVSMRPPSSFKPSDTT